MSSNPPDEGCTAFDGNSAGTRRIGVPSSAEDSRSITSGLDGGSASSSSPETTTRRFAFPSSSSPLLSPSLLELSLPLEGLRSPQFN